MVEELERNVQDVRSCKSCELPFSDESAVSKDCNFNFNLQTKVAYSASLK